MTIDSTDLQALASSGIQMSESNGTVILRFDAPLFSSRVALDPDQKKCLNQLGGVLAKHATEWRVTVVGHTDATPMRSTGPYQDNRELGLGRAVEVVRYWIRNSDIPASMLTAATAGDENPPFPGEDSESKLKNRTVTIRISASGK